jgi:hypothetical protein
LLLQIKEGISVLICEGISTNGEESLLIGERISTNIKGSVQYKGRVLALVVDVTNFMEMNPS